MCLTLLRDMLLTLFPPVFRYPRDILVIFMRYIYDLIVTVRLAYID